MIQFLSSFTNVAVSFHAHFWQDNKHFASEVWRKKSTCTPSDIQLIVYDEQMSPRKLAFVMTKQVSSISQLNVED